MGKEGEFQPKQQNAMEKLIPVRDPSEIPPSMSEEEEVKFWQTHGLSEEYFDKRDSMQEHNSTSKDMIFRTPTKEKRSKQ